MTTTAPPFLLPPLTDPLIVPYISRSTGKLRYVIASDIENPETSVLERHWTCTGTHCAGRTCYHIRAAMRLTGERVRQICNDTERTTQ